MTERALAMLVLAAAACGKSESKAPAPTGPAIDVAAVNALVPAALQNTLVFEKRDLVVERGKRKIKYTLAAPRGWSQDGKLFAHLKPEDRARLYTRLEVGANCDGECVTKPWAEIADRVNFAPRARGHVMKDERAAGRRTMIAEVDTSGETTTDVVVAWWSDSDKRYRVCTAILDDALRDAAPAFERACQAVQVDGDD